VSAAAALLLGQDPSLTPGQVAWLLERYADDDNLSTGCAQCPGGRDQFTGWGTLDVLSSLTALTGNASLPSPDRLEPNDDAGPWAHVLPPLPHTISASLDYWDDDVDVYRVQLHKRQSVFARLTPAGRASVRLQLWPPGTTNVAPRTVRQRLATSHVARGRRVGTQLRLAFTAKVAGTYYLEAKLLSQTRDPVQYRLAVSRR
jgi:hypothetical protein